MYIVIHPSVKPPTQPASLHNISPTHVKSSSHHYMLTKLLRTVPKRTSLTTNYHTMSDAPVAFLPLGAIIQTLRVGGVNIVQGFPSQPLYETHNAPYFGETIGRVANRVAGATLRSLNGGRSYPLAANNGPNNLHGGVVGWGKKVWQGPTPVGVREIPGIDGLDGGESVKFTLTSPDGDEGFPGTVEASVVYIAGKQVQDGKEVIVLGIEYEAELTGGADETVINMTNHSYAATSFARTLDLCSS